jgi:SAM-dependent methyltransferase
VRHRDLVPLHVEQLSAAACDAGLGGRVDTAVGDATALDLPDDSADAVLLLGPLYHLVGRADRVQALREAARIARPGAPVLAAAISRWAPRLHGEVSDKLYRREAFFPELVALVEATGRLNDAVPGWFTGYCHRPGELWSEAVEAGLDVEDLVGVEGLSFALSDLAERLADPADRDVVLGAAGAVERVPELLGLSPHLLVVARALTARRHDVTEPADAAGLEAADDRLEAAIRTNDAAGLALALHDDLVARAPDGRLVGKAEDVEGYASGAFRVTSLERLEREVVLHGGTGVTLVGARLRAVSAGEPLAAFVHYTRTWVHDDGRWQVIAAHVGATPL